MHNTHASSEKQNQIHEIQFNNDTYLRVNRLISIIDKPEWEKRKRKRKVRKHN